MSEWAGAQSLVVQSKPQLITRPAEPFANPFTMDFAEVATDTFFVAIEETNEKWLFKIGKLFKFSYSEVSKSTLLTFQNLRKLVNFHTISKFESLRNQN